MVVWKSSSRKAYFEGEDLEGFKGYKCNNILTSRRRGPRDELREVFVLVIILCESSITVTNDLLVDESAEEGTCHHFIALTWPFPFSTITTFIFYLKK